MENEKDEETTDPTVPPSIQIKIMKPSPGHSILPQCRSTRVQITAVPGVKGIRFEASLDIG